MSELKCNKWRKIFFYIFGIENQEKWSKFLIVSAISTSLLMFPIAMADTSQSGFYFTAGVGTGLENEIDD